MHLILKFILLVSELISLQLFHLFLLLHQLRLIRSLLLLLSLYLSLTPRQQLLLVLSPVPLDPPLFPEPLAHLPIQCVLNLSLPPLHQVLLPLDGRTVPLLVKPGDLRPVQLRLACCTGFHRVMMQGVAHLNTEDRLHRGVGLFYTLVEGSSAVADS